MKIFSNKRYELKKIGNLIKDKPAKERSEIKVKELAKIKLPKKFIHNGYNIEIVEQPYWTLRNGNTLLIIIIRASQNGQPLNVDDGVFEYINPPIMVPDGTYHKEVTDRGVEFDSHNLVEDPELALKEIICETIRILNK